MRNVCFTSALFFVTVSCLSQTPAPTVADAHNHLEQGHVEQAIVELQELVKVQPFVKGAKRELGIAYYRTGKLIDAEHTFAEAMTEDSADIESIQMRGLTLYRMGRPADAIPFLERVRQWTPDANADANYVLGLCYMNAQRYDEARSTFAAQYEVSRESGAAYLITAKMFLRSNLPELAAQYAAKALELTPQLPGAHFLLGEVFLFRSDTVKALEQFELEQQMNPGNAAVYDRLGDVYTRTAQYQKAQEALTRSISLDQSSTGPFIQLGKVFLRRNDPQTAILYLEHAAHMDPSNYTTHTLLAQAFRGVGRQEDAKRETDLVSRIHSSDELKLQPVQ